MRRTGLLTARAFAGGREAPRSQAYGAPVATTWAGVLLDLEPVDPRVLRELVTEAWVDRAPARLVREHLGDPS